MSFTDNLIALPTDVAGELAPQVVRFAIDTADSGLDMSTATSVRAKVERPDHDVLSWDFDIESSDPARTADSITVKRTCAAGDFADSSSRTLAGTWVVRFLVTFPSGERAMNLAWFPVEAFL